MCNLYSITTNQAAIAALFRVVNRYVGNLAPMPGIRRLRKRRELVKRKPGLGNERRAAPVRDQAIRIGEEIDASTRPCIWIAS